MHREITVFAHNYSKKSNSLSDMSFEYIILEIRYLISPTINTLLEDEDTTLEAKGQDLVENRWDQNENGWDQNEMENNKKVFPPREYSNDNRMVEKVFTPREHNNENACSEKMYCDEHKRKKEKQMTYREAL